MLTCYKVVRTKNLQGVTLVGIERQHGLTGLFDFVLLLWELKQ